MMQILVVLSLYFFMTIRASPEAGEEHWTPRKPYAEPVAAFQLQRSDFSYNFSPRSLFGRQDSIQCASGSGESFTCPSNETCCNGLPAKGCCDARQTCMIANNRQICCPTNEGYVTCGGTNCVWGICCAEPGKACSGLSQCCKNGGCCDMYSEECCGSICCKNNSKCCGTICCKSSERCESEGRCVPSKTSQAVTTVKETVIVSSIAIARKNGQMSFGGAFIGSVLMLIL